MSSIRKEEILRDVSRLIVKIASLKKGIKQLKSKQQLLIAEIAKPSGCKNELMMPQMYRLNDEANS